MPEFDSPWKEALEAYFESFLELCFQELHALIDWQTSPVFLDKELQRIVPESLTGPRIVDKLVKVRLKDGQERWIMIHVEVQTQSQVDFGERMFSYFHRIRDRYRLEVVSLAVLGDANPQWRPNRYHWEFCGCRIEFTFPIVKLLDFANRKEILEQSQNVFAVIVAAHLASQATQRDMNRRYDSKWSLVRSLYQRNLSADQVRKLFRLIDWFMELPIGLKEQFTEQLNKFEEEQQMPYISSVEQMAQERGFTVGREKGLEEGAATGLRQGILAVIQLRFGDVPPEIDQAINQIGTSQRLQALLETSKTTASLEDFARALR